MKIIVKRQKKCYNKQSYIDAERDVWRIRRREESEDMFNRDKKDGQKENKPSIVTRETIGVTLGVFSVLILLISFTGSLVFGEVGTAITSFLFGVFGFMTYPVFLSLTYLAVALVAGRNFIPGRLMTASGFFLVALVGLLVHAAVTAGYPQDSYGAYLSACFAAGENGAFGCTPFGLVGGIITYPFTAIASHAGTYILFAAGIVLCLYLFVNSILKYKGIRLSLSALRRKEKPEEQRGQTGEGRQATRPVSFSELDNDRMPQTAEERQPYYGAYGAPAGNEPPAPSYTAAPAGGYGQDRAPSRAEETAYPPVYGQTPSGAYANGDYAQPTARGYAAGMSADDGRRVLYGQAAEEDEKEEDYSSHDRSKKILYGSGNPAEYRNRNLIFDSSSHYNNRPQAPSRGSEGENYGASYADMYAKGIDGNNTPAAKPREIVREEGSGQTGYSMYRKDVFGTYEQESREQPAREAETYTGDDFAEEEDRSEPIRPSYHAPVSGASESRDSGSFREETARQEKVADVPRTAEHADGLSPRENDSASVAETEPVSPRGGENMTLGERFRADREMQAAEHSSSRGENRTVPAAQKAEEEDFVSDRDGLFDGEFGADFADDTEDDVPDYRVDSRREVAQERGREGLSSALRDRTENGRLPERMPERNGDRFPSAGGAVAGETALPPARESAPPVRETPPPPKPKPRIPKEYVRPTLDIFNSYSDTVSVDPAEIEWSKQGIVETLEGFNISVEIVGVKVGPSFTRYDINFPKNVTVKSIARCADNIAMTLRAEKINITTNFAQGTIAIEVPNRKRATVGMRTMLQAEDYINAKPGSLTFCLGKNIEGKPVCTSLVKMPHLLVAGTSGSGKSVFLHQLIVSLIMKYSPEELRLILIDPKGNEFAAYRGLPNLMVNEIISDVNKAIVVLNWLINEMEHRYLLFTQMTEAGKVVRNIDEYNAAVAERTDRLPKIVVVADELADFMMQAKKDIEDRISRLAAKSRAAGIHLVLATQRPSVDIITGVLKSNLSSRVALRVGAEVDSRVILDESGAENLLGAGDLLYKTGSMFSVERVQAAWISDKELESFCDFLREHNEAYYDETAAQFIDSGGKSAGGGVGEEEGDGEVEPVYIDALRFVVQSGSASISMIQRKCSVGYNKAGKIIEWMETSGYISPFEGAKSRKVLLTADEFREKYGEL